MEIHELNTFSGTLGSGDFFATDNGNDTSKVSAESMFAPLNERIDNIIAGPAPSAQEVTDARLGASVLGSVSYNSLGNAVRGQATELYNDITDTRAAISDGNGNVILSDTLKSATENDETVINISALELVATDKRFTISNGAIALENMSTARVYRMPSDNVSKLSVTLNQAFAQWFYVAAVSDANGNVTADSQGRSRYLIRKTLDDGSYNTAEFTPISGGYVYINMFGNNSNPYYNKISCINYEKISDAYKAEIRAITDNSLAVATLVGQVNDTMVVQTISDLELVATNKKFEVSNGQISLVDATAIAVYRMPSDNVSKLSITTRYPSEGGWLYGAAVADANGNVSASSVLMFNGVQTYTTEFTPVSGGYVYINLWGYATVPNKWYDDISFVNYENISYNFVPRFKTMVRKPFAWSGKTINFTGDSITKGYINGEEISANYNYPKLFCSAVNATPVNLAVGGATFATDTAQAHIIDQVISSNKNNDLLFIAGGINDWAFGVELSTFANAIKQICDYLNNAQSGFQNKPVIWITPINQGGWEDTHVVDEKGTLFDYRNTMTRIIIENDTYARFSIIQGNEFAFPTKDDDATFINLMYGDKLHPSELGYKTAYLSGLLTVLC